MKIFTTTIITALALTSIAWRAHAAAPIVSNVVASQRNGTKLIDIRYDVVDADGDLLKVRVEISHNGGTSYTVPAVSLSGDIGANIKPGLGKLIVWNAAIDWDGEYSPQMRVKVIASDSRGFPGLQWGQEVPPGGFLLGQDGGAEGVGPAKHVNIPYSFWLSKYEITVEEYAEFLNTALAAGEVVRAGSQIKANANVFLGVPAGTDLYLLQEDIQWSLNKLVVVQTIPRLPVRVNWYGAIAFAQHYGYDLPTDAEWEKAARGPDHDGLGEHLLYPWGNSIGRGDADLNPTRRPVGSYDGTQSPVGPDRANAYGLYDMIGNAYEWTRTASLQSDAYPATESINNAIHSLPLRGNVSLRSVGASYARQEYHPTQQSGFRVARRSQ